MKLVIKEKGKLMSLFPREEEPNMIDDKAQYYDMKKLQQWEQKYEEILISLEGSEHREGMRLLFELAEEGYPEARRLLSDMYLEGKKLPESFRKALEWERRAQYADRLFRDKGYNSLMTE